MLVVNFKKDWQTHIETELAGLGFQFTKAESLDIATIRYFNIKRRLLPQRIRNIHESQEFRIPLKYKIGYCELKKCITAGGSLRLYLSRQIIENKKPISIEKINPDLQLNDWGITHLHLSPLGTKDVVFAMFTDTDVFMLQIFSHGQGHSDVWTNIKLVEILHNNWPEKIVAYKCIGITNDCLTGKQRRTLRSNHGNVLIKVADGTSYYPFGGGMMASGHCLIDRVETDKLLNKLTEWELLVKNNENNFREALKISGDEKLFFKMIFSNQECYLYEPNKHIKFSLSLA